jgi:hypothetical protein
MGAAGLLKTAPSGNTIAKRTAAIHTKPTHRGGMRSARTDDTNSAATAPSMLPTEPHAFQKEQPSPYTPNTVLQ